MGGDTVVNKVSALSKHTFQKGPEFANEIN